MTLGSESPEHLNEKSVSLVAACGGKAGVRLNFTDVSQRCATDIARLYKARQVGPSLRVAGVTSDGSVPGILFCTDARNDCSLGCCVSSS
jgi:hypothetical protein